MYLISRQAAIDALAELQGRAYTKAELKGISKAWKRIKQLPSAQPYTDEEIQKMQELEQAELQKAYECGMASAQLEIVRCKDCKYWDKTWTNDWAEGYHYCPNVDGIRKVDFYCADAERREDEA